jgi:hypothetical protein
VPAFDGICVKTQPTDDSPLDAVCSFKVVQATVDHEPATKRRNSRSGRPWVVRPQQQQLAIGVTATVTII